MESFSVSAGWKKKDLKHKIYNIVLGYLLEYVKNYTATQIYRYNLIGIRSGTKWMCLVYVFFFFFCQSLDFAGF